MKKKLLTCVDLNIFPLGNNTSCCGELFTSVTGIRLVNVLDFVFVYLSLYLCICAVMKLWSVSVWGGLMCWMPALMGFDMRRRAHWSFSYSDGRTTGLVYENHRTTGLVLPIAFNNQWGQLEQIEPWWCSSSDTRGLEQQAEKFAIRPTWPSLNMSRSDVPLLGQSIIGEHWKGWLVVGWNRRWI